MATYSAKFVYTVTNRQKLVDQAVRSIKSLLNFVDKEDIIVFYTPPRSRRNLRKLSKVATVIEAPNLTKPFVFTEKRGASRYGEKIHLCDIDCSNVIFLDADTIVKKNILNLLNGKYDLSARIGQPLNKQMNKEIWQQMFTERGKDPIPIPNTGFLIFKNYCHKKIKQEWLQYINDDDLPNPHPVNNLKDQYALALAISGKQIRWMTKYEHAYRWLNEEKTDTFVLHGTENPPLHRIKRLIKTIERSRFKFMSKKRYYQYQYLMR
ncbi:hypothetical protein DRO69_07220 [Candidatus Bathyarchaeota archaeon]|nr:MAG: hypothetical protein DRO69_07220 [Candidatus Bathyarchaeota archaeon]